MSVNILSRWSRRHSTRCQENSASHSQCCVLVEDKPPNQASPRPGQQKAVDSVLVNMQEGKDTHRI